MMCGTVSSIPFYDTDTTSTALIPTNIASAIIGHATTVQYIITPEHVAILVLKDVS